MTKKQILRCCAFVLVVCCVLTILNDLLELKNSTNYDKRFNTYANFETDMIDTVYIGTSGVDRYYMAPKAFEEYGISSYTLSSDGMPSWLFVDVIKYALEMQSPELFIIDIRAFSQTNTDLKYIDARARRVLDAMDYFSVSRFRTAFTTMRYMRKASSDNPRFDLSYILSFIKFHSKWSEDDYSFNKNLGSKKHRYGSFYINSGKSASVEVQEPVIYNPDFYTDLDPLSKDSLYELLDYIKENKLNVLFVDTPHFKDEYEMGTANTVIKILKENNLDYISYCETDKEGNFINCPEINRETDFYNDSHVNYYGAEKFTSIFTKYLNDNYDIPDRRNEKDVAEYWAEMSENIDEKMAKVEEKAKS